MADAAFKTAPYAAYTTDQLRAVIANGNGTEKMVAEIERRAKRDAGDVSVMMPAERLRYARVNPA